MTHHYSDKYEEEAAKHELETIDMSHYTNQRWYDEMTDYLVNVMSMNKKQVKAEFDRRFPELLVRTLDL